MDTGDRASSFRKRESELIRAVFMVVVLTSLIVIVVGGGCLESYDDERPGQRHEESSRYGLDEQDQWIDTMEVEPIEELEELEVVAPATPEEAPPESTRLDDDPFDNFRDAYRRHYEQTRRTLLHVTVDRPMYQPGQSLHWVSWHLNPGDLLSAEGTRNVEIELTDAQGATVAEETVRLQSGLAQGTLEIDEEATGGNYTLKLTDGEREYERPILVSRFEPPRFRKSLDFSQTNYRPGESVEAEVEILRDDGRAPAGMEIEGYLQIAGRHVLDLSTKIDGRGQGIFEFELPQVIEEDDAVIVFSVSEGGMVETGIFPVPLALEEVTLQFFPEGGELVHGLTSRVYFEATDLSGEPVEVEGILLDETGEELAQLETIHDGRGIFEVTPQKDANYSVVLTDPGQDESFDLPEASEDGCVVKAYDDLDSTLDAVRVGVWCSKNQLVGVIGAMGDELFDVARVVAGREQPAVVYLRPEDDKWPRPAGIVRVTVVEDDRNISPLAERLVFRGRRAQLGIEMNFDREFYHPGEAVEVVIETRGPDGEPLPAELAKAMVDDRLYARATGDAPNIVAQTLLASDDLHFWGDVKEGDEYFDLYADTAAGLDMLMGVAGWRPSDKRDNFYVDGGKVQIPRPPPPPVRRARHRPQPRHHVIGRGGAPAPERAEVLLLDAEPVMAEDLGGLGVRTVEDRRSAPAQAAPQPMLDAVQIQSSADEEVSADQSEKRRTLESPQFFRDDDAGAFSGWQPSLETDEEGRLIYRFDMPQAVGAYRMALEGVSPAGLVGRAEEVVRIEVPLSVTTRLPEVASGGDRVKLPVTLRNTTPELMVTTVEITAEGPALINDEWAKFEMEIPAGSTATRFIPVDVEDSRDEIVIRLWAQGGGFSDGVERRIDVEPRGFRRTWHASGQTPGQSRHRVPLMGMTDAGAEAELVIYPNPATEALQGVESMTHRPIGCFEQTSSRNHPNLLVWEYLENNDQLEGDFVQTLRSHIDAGHERLLGFETAGGGFEWFGRGKGQAYLTAWGLVQFTKAEAIIDDFDRSVIDRSVAFMRSLRSDDGWWDSTRDDEWQRTSGDRRRAAELFALYGLAYAGQIDGFEAQLDRAVEIAGESEHAYEIALVAATLAHSGTHGGSLQKLSRRLVQMQNGDGSWTPGSSVSWAGGYGGAFQVETTGLAASALIESGASRQAITSAIKWLDANKRATAWWGTTIATVMALEARVAFEREGLDTSQGPVTLVVDGREVGQVNVSSEDRRPSRIDGFGDLLEGGINDVRIISNVPVNYDLEVNFRVEKFDDGGEGPVDFQVWLGDGDSVALGREQSIRARVENLEDDALGMVLLRVALPAGLEVEPRELDALVDRSAVDFYETTAREIILYFREFDGGEVQELRWSAVAAVPGRFESPPSVAYPYYRDESYWSWGEAGQFEVRPR